MVYRGTNFNGYVIKYCEVWKGFNVIVKLYLWIFDFLKSLYRNRFFCFLVSWYVYKKRYFKM